MDEGGVPSAEASSVAAAHVGGLVVAVGGATEDDSLLDDVRTCLEEDASGRYGDSPCKQERLMTRASTTPLRHPSRHLTRRPDLSGYLKREA